MVMVPIAVEAVETMSDFGRGGYSQVGHRFMTRIVSLWTVSAQRTTQSLADVAMGHNSIRAILHCLSHSQSSQLEMQLQ